MAKENEADTSSGNKESKTSESKQEVRVEPTKSEKKEQAAGPSDAKSNKEKAKESAGEARESQPVRKAQTQPQEEERPEVSPARPEQPEAESPEQETTTTPFEVQLTPEGQEAVRKLVAEALINMMNQGAERARTEGARTAGMSPDQQLEMGYEVPPSLEAGPQEALGWFYGRLEYLEENFANQSFDARWQLTSPLEQFIIRNSKKIGKDLEKPFTYKDKTYRNYEELSKDLSDMLEARRARHNQTYVFRRATGTEDLIGAAGMLDLKNIETLLHIPEVADKLRQLEKVSHEFREKKDEGVKDAENPKLKEALGIQESNWAGRIAGGLYSALGEAARFDMQINQSGDFFWNRVQNFSDRAAATIEVRYPTKEKGGSIDKKTQDEVVATIAPAMNLMTETFLADKVVNKEKGKKLNVETYGIGERQIKNVITGKAETVLDLSNFKFEKLNLGRRGENALGMTADDALRISMLDINDANGVRKAIWDPGGYLDRPNSKNLMSVYPLLKHLKGKERVAWFKGAVEATVKFNKESWWDVPMKPAPLKDSLSKRVFGWDPWNRGFTGEVISSYRSVGLLDHNAGNELLDEHMGKAPTRFLRGSFMEFLRILFGSLYKGYQAMEKTTK